MNHIIDSSGWIEYFIGGPHRVHFRPFIHNTEDLIVPSVTLFEVFKRFLVVADETQAIEATNQMRKGKVIELNEYLAVWAAKLSEDLKLPMADSIILATAYSTGATVYTMDSNFEGIEGVNYVAKT